LDTGHNQLVATTQGKNSKYAGISNVARDIFSIISHGVGVEASFFLARDVIGWRQSKTTGETLRKKLVVRQFAQANSWILAGTDPESDTTDTENEPEMKKEAEERKLHRMAKVHDILEMGQGSQNLCATQKQSRILFLILLSCYPEYSALFILK
jgi:hypothetical protein